MALQQTRASLNERKSRYTLTLSMCHSRWCRRFGSEAFAYSLPCFATETGCEAVSHYPSGQLICHMASMPRRRKKKIVRVIHPSAGPLPLRLAALHAGRLLVFSDASQKRHGGLAAVFFAAPDSEALVRTRTVSVVGSNELELQAAIFALEQAHQLFPGRPLALFSDNQDAVVRLNRGKIQGLDQDPELQRCLASFNLVGVLANASIDWIKGHSNCRGNILADLHALEAAS